MKSYTEQGCHQLNLDKLEISALVRETLVALMMDIATRISYSPSRCWGSSNKPDYAGAWIATITHVGIDNKTKIHGKVINHLFNAGIICVDRKETKDKRIIFQLSPDAIEHMRELRCKIMFPTRKVVRWDDLDEMAALYGVKVEYIRTRGLLRLLTLDGKSFRTDEYITENKAGEPVTKINDLSWDEWAEILNGCAELIEGKRTA